MKTILAGTRSITDAAVLEEAIAASGYCITVVISGMADGVDALGVEWAKRNRIPYDPYPAVWRTPGGIFISEAGKMRNRQMARVADALVAVWDGHSPGTSNMIAEMKTLGKLVYVHRYTPEYASPDIT